MGFLTNPIFYDILKYRKLKRKILMVLTNKQEQGLKIAVERYKSGEPYTWIGGYAGTGKSTLIRFIVAALGIDPLFTTYIAYTGKAVQVLKQKGCLNAMTAHKLLYKSYPNKDGTFKHIPVGSLAPIKLVIVDEISMLPKQMWELLLSHATFENIYIVALGDPGQLPPVSAEDNEVLQHPHIFLDEVMRQAQESEIIRLTMDIRDGKDLSLQRGTEVRVVPRDEINQSGFFFWADQILVAKNETRHQLNDIMRHEKWKEEYNDTPLIGDKLICLRNNWEIFSTMGDPLVNGLTGLLTHIAYTKSNPYMKKTPRINFMPDYEEAGEFQNIEIDYSLITTHEPTIKRGPDGNWRKIPKVFHPEEFDYGYAITVHKSQGSEWDKIIVIEEFLKNASKEAHKKWLYTAATRASKKLIIVKPV